MSVDLDQLMKSISAEAKQLEVHQVSSASKIEKPLLNLTELIGNINFNPISEIKPKQTYKIRELVGYEDAQFIKNVFIALLHRQPDDQGFSDYLGALRSGKSKLAIIASILGSTECRAIGIHVRNASILKLIVQIEQYLPEAFYKETILKGLYSIFGIKFAESSSREEEVLSLIDKTFAKIKETLIAADSQISSLNAENIQLKKAIQNIEAGLLENRSATSNLQHRLTYQSQLLALTQERKEISDISQPFDISSADVDAFYVAFEDACIGSREEIHEKLIRWLDFIPSAEQCSARALDIGCGRGEWLSILENNGYTTTGIDINPIMVKSCQELGLDAQQVDVLSWLSAQESESLSVITAFHVVEHIPFEQLLRWTAEAYRVLEPGGVLIFETPNPENPLVGSHTFYHDPTHRNPITPTLLTFLGNYTGFESVSIERLHPYPEEARVNGIDPLTDRINGLLCGPQDFALVAKKQGLAS